MDRLDYSKGLVNRLDAFGRLLAHHPEHRQAGQLPADRCAIARGRQRISGTCGIELDRIVGDTNGRYSEFDWVPVRYMTRTVRRGTLAGFYRVAQHGGGHAVARRDEPGGEGIRRRARRRDPGVLILSRFAGAAEELTEALIVNPFDPDEIADAMQTALTMRLEERQARHRALREKVWAATARRFSERFLAALEGTGGSDGIRA